LTLLLKFDKCLNLSLDAPCCKHDMWTYLVLYSVNWKYWIDPCRENELLIYMPTSLINEMFEPVPWYEILYVNLFGFVFHKMKVLEWLCRKNDILVYMPTSLINGKFELVPWCETRYVNLFGFVFGKMKVWEWLCRENEILVYMPTSLINEMFELFPWYKKLYVNLLCFVFNKMKVLEWPLSRKWDYSIYD